ncbi:ribonuclease H-like domain-containing protein [Tanacetum coccineum]
MVPPSPNAELVCTKEEDGDIMFIKIIPRDDNFHKEEPEPRVQEVEYFDIFPTRSELAYLKYLMEVPSFDGPEPQPLLNSPSLDVSLGDVIGPEPPIKPHSPDSSRMKEMFDDDWGLKSKEVSPLGEELSLFDSPSEVERGRILEAHRLEPILQQQISQRMAPSHHDERGDGVTIYTRRRHHDTYDGVTSTLTASNAQVIFDEKKLGNSQLSHDVIENGNSFKPAAQTTTNADSSSTTLIPCPVTTDEKTQKRNDVKARSMLLMALPNEHLLTFNQYKDAKTLFAAIQTRFGGNDATKKTQKTLLKQMYENFSAPSTESLNSIFNRLRKIWNTHVVVWRNKPDLDTMSFDDLYNNFKIVEQEVKGTASSSSSSQNVAFVSSSSSTNEVNTAYEVSTTNTQVSPASTQITINRSDTARYDKSKVECFNYHKLGHFARECRGPRNQDNRSRNQDSSRRTINVEEISSKAMLAIDGAGFDWSYMADDEVPTNMALMAFSDSEVHNDKTCSKTCLKSFETLKTQLDDLRIEFNKSEFNLATYKRGLASVEEQLVFYKKNEVLFCEQLAVLKRDISYKDSEISVLKSELEKLKQEKESNQLKIENFDNASKSLDKLIGSQIPDKSRKGLGFVSYNVVPPPPTGLFSPPNLDLSNSGLEEFQQPEFEGYGPKTSKSVSEDTSNEVRESPDASLVEELVSNDKLEKKIVFPTVAKINFVRPQQQEKPVRKPVKYAEMYRSQTPRGNQRNWNNQKSQQLGSDFVMYNKACFVCGSFDHVQANCNYHQRERMVSGNNYTRVNYNYSAKKAHPSAHRNIVPRAVLMKTGLRPLNIARPVNTAHPKNTIYNARPMSCFSKSAQSTVKRPYRMRTTLTNKFFCQKVNTAKGKVNTVRQNTAVVVDPF